MAVVPRTPHELYGSVLPTIEQARDWIGSRVIDATGAGVGRLVDVWVDDETGEPAWLLIREGRLSGGKKKLAPFAGSTGGGGQVWLPHRREQIRTSPLVRAEQLLGTALHQSLRGHYGLDRTAHPTLQR